MNGDSSVTEAARALGFFCFMTVQNGLGPASLQWELKIFSQQLEYADQIAESNDEGCIYSWSDSLSIVFQLSCLGF
jgi:hypothetical protein